MEVYSKKKETARLIQNVLEYCEAKNLDGIIFLDFEKALDSVE